MLVQDYEFAIREVELLQSCMDHTNVVQLLEVGARIGSLCTQGVWASQGSGRRPYMHAWTTPTLCSSWRWVRISVVRALNGRLGVAGRVQVQGGGPTYMHAIRLQVQLPRIWMAVGAATSLSSNAMCIHIHGRMRLGGGYLAPIDSDAHAIHAIQLCLGCRITLRKRCGRSVLTYLCQCLRRCTTLLLPSCFFVCAPIHHYIMHPHALRCMRARAGGCTWCSSLFPSRCTR